MSAEISRKSPVQNKQEVHFFQIAYSEETMLSVSPEMKALDNRENLRPDWAEYWPIRNFLIAETLDENAFYAFLSPKFSFKTLINPADAVNFARNVDSDVDVIGYSPAFDIRAAFRNDFERAEYMFPGFMEVCEKVWSSAVPEGPNLREIVNTSFTAILCNYFAAKPRFWREWLKLGEKIFAMAENPNHSCAHLLNGQYAYGDPFVTAKVFVQELMVSWILGTTKTFKIAKYPSSSLNLYFDKFPYALYQAMDTLKIESVKGEKHLMSVFYAIQSEILADPSVTGWRMERLAEARGVGLARPPSAGYEHWVSNSISNESGKHEKSRSFLQRLFHV